MQIETQDKLSRTQKAKMMTLIKEDNTFIGFNSARYDYPVLCAAMEGMHVYDLFKLSERIVSENLPAWRTMNEYALEPLRMNHIDISEPAPAVFVSLKGYGARLHSQRLQDLPYEYDKRLTGDEIDVIRKYNINDLDTTIDLYHAIQDRIELREEMSKDYNTDLRSKSDAQIAETVIVKELTRAGVSVSRPTVPKAVKYTAPSCVQFDNMLLQGLLKRVQTETFKINQKNGSPVLPDWLKKFPLTIGGTTYQIGIGGLHSKEKKMVVIPTEDEVLRNIDVASYYPSMILEFGFYPKRLTAKFLDVYRNIYVTRLSAKARRKVDPKAATVDAGLKIVLNGSFGKLGSMYSKLYAPDLMLQVTITGQLMLLMLIERLEAAGIAVKSSNTDGVEILCPKSKEAILEAIVFDWELETGMVMEHGQYKALYARDVNNYVAVYEDEVKAKGVYADPTLQKNSEYPIVFTAIKKYLFDGTPLANTITECKDIRQFLTARTVKGGGVWRDKYLGKVVRWYYSTDGDSIHYKSNGNKVPKSDGARPLMDLGETLNGGMFAFPSDLSYAKYLDLAIGHLRDLGVEYYAET